MKKILKLVIIILISVFSFLIGQSFNKYATSIKEESISEIATWNFIINEKKEENQLIDLASTIDNKSVLAHKIAPGTRRQF